LPSSRTDSLTALDAATGVVRWRFHAGGPLRRLMKEVRGVQVHDELVVTLTPDARAPVREAVLCGVEVLAEGW
jgi:hypothetical protein